MTRIIFASGTPHGGAVDSTRALAQLAADHGHKVAVLLASVDPYEDQRPIIRVAVKLERRMPFAAPVIWRLVNRAVSTTTQDRPPSTHCLLARDVPGALSRLARREDIVVLNSMRTLDLRRSLDIIQSRDARSVWYLRETAALAAIPEMAHRPEAIVANSRPLAAEVERLSGRSCEYIPSYVSMEGLIEPEQPRTVLFVNPVESHGLERVVRCAQLMPETPFCLQESWPLGDLEWRDLVTRIDRLENVELRRRTDRVAVFRDACVLLAPYEESAIGLSRPRTALEAQHLGVPLVCSDVPGLRQLATAPELVVPNEATDEVWAKTIRLAIDNRGKYTTLARSRADQELIDSDTLWAQFESLIESRTVRR